MKKRKKRGRDAVAVGPATGATDATTSERAADAATPDAASSRAAAGTPAAVEDWGQPAADGEGVAAQPASGEDEVTNRITMGGPEEGRAFDAFETTTQDTFELADLSLLGEVGEAGGDASGDDAGDGVPEAAGGPADQEQAATPSEADLAADVDGASEPLPAVEGSRLESIIESLLFAADRPLVVNELKRLLAERDGKRVTDALENLRAKHADSGVQLVSVAGGWQLRTHPGNGAWVAKLVAGRPTRLSRAMMETLAIVAYRQPITRPEIDEIRGVDCGPVLRTLLDRALIRVIGKKEEVGRPILYGTTPEFLKIFSLRDLADLPTLREFHELGADDRAKVDASATGDGAFAAEGLPAGASPGPGAVQRGALPDVDPEEEDSLMAALEQASNAAGRATRSAAEPEALAEESAGGSASTSSDAAAESSEAGRR